MNDKYFFESTFLHALDECSWKDNQVTVYSGIEGETSEFIKLVSDSALFRR